MGRRYSRIRRQKSTEGPSKFFLIALGIGLVLFLIFFVMIIVRPPKPKLGMRPAVPIGCQNLAPIPA